MILSYKEERLAIFIDGANLYGMAKGLQFDVDYRKVFELYADRGRLIRASYYTAMMTDDEFSPLRPMVDWLEYNGYKIVTKELKEFTDSQGRLRRKGDMGVDIAVDALMAAPHVDHLIIFSGDGDLYPLVDALQRLGKRVTIISTIKTNPVMCADELRRIADNFIDLADLQDRIAKAPAVAPVASKVVARG